MKRPLKPAVKLTLLFGPFVLFFIALTVLVNDIRHPLAVNPRNENCIVTGTGEDARPYRTKGHYLYRQSENARSDVSLRCDRMGTVLINDAQLFMTAIGSGQAATITRKRYRYLPDRWELNVRTGIE